MNESPRALDDHRLDLVLGKSAAEQLTIFEILLLIDINSHRLECSFGTDCS